jgi:hypothetical protein
MYTHIYMQEKIHTLFASTFADGGTESIESVINFLNFC